jgi:hypothetical protein
MTTMTAQNNYVIVSWYNGFAIEREDGTLLRNRYGAVREFATRNSARKRIARERSGDFHR